MANSTDEYWDVDGVSLQTLATNIVTWGGDREAPPSLRGDNPVVPSRAGSLFIAKTPESRIMTLSMWVIGADSNGNVPTNGPQRALFEKNWKELRRLLWKPRRQIVLTKRFREYGDTGVTVATALAQYAGGLNPTMQGRSRAVFTVDLELHDPYFYGPVLTTPALSGTQTNVTVLGDDRTHRVKINVTGARAKPKVTNVAPEGGTVWAELDYSVIAGSAAVADSYEFRAVNTTGGVTSEFGSKVSHDGSPYWLYLEPGVNKISMTSQSGTGAVTLSYQAAYL